jgi:hypothetical protein
MSWVGYTNHTNPSVVVDGGGNAIAAWLNANDGASILTAARYDAQADAWGAPIAVDEVTGKYSHPMVPFRLAGNPEGTAVIIWSKTKEGEDWPEVFASRTSPEKGDWEAPAEVTNSYQKSWIPDVGVDSEGNAMAVWLEGWPIGTIRASRYDVQAGTWGEAVDLVASAYENGFRIAVDGSGNAIVALEYSNTIGVRRYDAQDDAWSENVTSMFSYAELSFPSVPSIAMNAAGAALLFWKQSDAVVWESEYEEYENRVYASVCE